MKKRLLSTPTQRSAEPSDTEAALSLPARWKRLRSGSRASVKLPMESRSSIGSCIVMLWASSLATPLNKLSSNVLQEIGHFFSPARTLIQISRRTVLYFDTESLSWKQHFRLSEDLSRYYYMCQALALVTPTSFLVCGGLMLRSGAHFIDSGKVIPLPRMTTARYDHCAISIRAADSVFVFGGGSRGASSLCEKFSFASGRWKGIRNMERNRLDINCSLHNGLVYLCGGDQEGTVETYDWKSDSFTLIPHLRLPIQKKCVSVVVEDSFLCISLRRCCKWKIETQELEASIGTNVSSLLCNGPVCVANGFVFIVGERSCVCYCSVKGFEITNWPLD